MRSFTAEQQAILDSPFKTEISWLFDIDASGNGSTDYYWSSKEKSWGGHDYSFRIINQDNIEMNRNQAESGRIAPSSFGFIATNPSSTLRSSDFDGGSVTVRLIIKANTVSYGEIELEIATWLFDIEQASMNRAQQLQFKCRDFLRKYLTGKTYPNTPRISSILPQTGGNDEGFCVPVTFGAPYIPLGTIATLGQAYYVVGKSASYTFTKARTPHDWAGSFMEWSASSTTFSTMATLGTDGNSYSLLQVIGMDTDWDGVADSNVVFKSGAAYSPMPVKYGKTSSLATTNPIDITNFILRDFGLPVSRIDSATRTSSAATMNTWGLSMNFGLWYYQDREKLLASLMEQCNTELIMRDKLYFKPHRKTPVATITKSDVVRTANKMEKGISIKGPAKFTYTPNTFTVKTNDSGYALAQDPTLPIDVLHTYLIPTKTTVNDISDRRVDCRWIGNAGLTNAYKVAKISLQRSLFPSGKVDMTCMPAKLGLECDDMVTVTPQDYGAGSGHEYDILIDSIQISKDLQVKIQGTRFSQDLDDFQSITASMGMSPTSTEVSSYSPVIQGPDGTSPSVNRMTGAVWVGNEICLDGNRGAIRIGLNLTHTNNIPFNVKDLLYLDTTDPENPVLEVTGNIHISNVPEVQDLLNINATATSLQILYQSEAPSSSIATVGDYWIDSDDKKMYRYFSAPVKWVSVQDTQIQTALTNASTALTVAGTKIKVFHSATQPIASEVGDIWIETDNNNLPRVWNGSTWQADIFNLADWSKLANIPDDLLYSGDSITNVTWSSTYLSGKLVASPIISGNEGYFSNIFKVGNDGIVIDGLNKNIRSANWATMTTGWKIDNSGDAQFNNINARGSITLTGSSSGVSNFTDIGSLATQDWVGLQNHVKNGDFARWDISANEAINGDMEAWTTTPGSPNGWAALSGTGASVVKNTTDMLSGSNCAQITSASSGNTTLYQACHTTRGIAWWKTKTALAGAWVKASSASRVRVYMSSDGTGASTVLSAYHSGSGNWEWLPMTSTITVPSDATYVEAGIQVAAGAVITVLVDSMYIEDGTVVPNLSAPEQWTISASSVYWPDLVNKKFGRHSLRLYSQNGSESYAVQDLHAAMGINYWKGRTISVGAWVYCSTANKVRLRVSDGVNPTYSSYHTGNSTWQFLTVTNFTVAANATELNVCPIRFASQAVSVWACTDGVILVEGTIIPQAWLSNGVTAPSGSGCFIDDSCLGFYKDGLWRAFIDNAGNLGLRSSSGTYGFRYFGSDASPYGEGDLILGDASGAHIFWDQSASTLGINNADIELSGGKQLTVRGHASTPGLLNWAGSDYSVTSQMSATGDNFYIAPIDEGAGVIDLFIGTQSYKFDNINMYSDNSINVLASADGNTEITIGALGSYIPRYSKLYLYQIGSAGDGFQLSSSYCASSAAMPDQQATVGGEATSTYAIAYLTALYSSSGASSVVLRRDSSRLDFSPGANNTINLGTNTYAWKDIYYYVAHDKCSILDDLDDVAILKSISSSSTKDGEVVVDKFGFPQMDLVAMPSFLTNKDKLAEDLSKESGQEITVKDLEDIAKGDKEAIVYKAGEENKIIDASTVIERTFRNPGMMLDLVMGAVKQLDARIGMLEQMIK